MESTTSPQIFLLWDEAKEAQGVRSGTWDRTGGAEVGSQPPLPPPQTSSP